MSEQLANVTTFVESTPGIESLGCANASTAAIFCDEGNEVARK
jgi:hypothetical protein